MCSLQIKYFKKKRIKHLFWSNPVWTNYHQCDKSRFKYISKKGKSQKFYNGPSPDEVALVEFASQMHFDCTLSTDHEVKMKSYVTPEKEEEQVYKVYRKMDFNSDRKRMSVIIKDPIDGKIKLLIKGAD